MTEAQKKAFDDYETALKALKAAEAAHAEAQRRAQAALETFNKAILEAK